MHNPVLVTGGAGYVGSHVCKALRAAGYDPVTYDNLCRGHRDLVRWGALEIGDVTDAIRLDAAFARHSPVAVMHLAGLVDVGASVIDPGATYRTNVSGTLELLAAMMRHGVHRLVFSSSCTVYGPLKSVPADETHTLFPISPYGRSKLWAEEAIRDFSAAHGLCAMVLRYFNAAGADPSGETGEVHDPEPHLIPSAFNAATGRRPALTIYGADRATPDGTCVRDYVHVADLAGAHVRALQELDRGLTATALNLGTGRGHSVLEVVQAVRRVTGRDVPVEVGSRRTGDADTLVADASAAKELLAWLPQFSLDAMVEHAWAWHRKRFGRA